MRMKEDAMRNGQTSPVSIGTENQFITDFALFPNPTTDTLTLIPFLQSFSNRYDLSIRWLLIPAMAPKRITASCPKTAWKRKVQLFPHGASMRFKPDPFGSLKTSYNEEQLHHLWGKGCGRIGTRNVKTASDMYENARYRAVRCEGCPLRCRCFKAKGNRTIVNHRLRQYKRRAKELLCSEKGLKHRGQRCIEPEAVFGQIKKQI